jgi:hypothetical protein
LAQSRPKLSRPSDKILRHFWSITEGGEITPRSVACLLAPRLRGFDVADDGLRTVGYVDVLDANVLISAVPQPSQDLDWDCISPHQTSGGLSERRNSPLRSKPAGTAIAAVGVAHAHLKDHETLSAGDPVNGVAPMIARTQTLPRPPPRRVVEDDGRSANCMRRGLSGKGANKSGTPTRLFQSALALPLAQNSNVPSLIVPSRLG